MFLKTQIKIPEVKTMSEMMTHHRTNSELENSDKHYLRGDVWGRGNRNDQNSSERG